MSHHSVNTSEANLLTNEEKELLPKMTNLNKLDKTKVKPSTVIKSSNVPDEFKNINFETGELTKTEKIKVRKGKTGVDVKFNKLEIGDKDPEYFNCDVILN